MSCFGDLVADSLLNILAKQKESPGSDSPCFDAGTLIEAGSRLMRDSLTPQSLARHLLNCFRCSSRWEVIQSDHHVELAELHVVRTLREHNFVRLRALNHVSLCQACRRNSEELDRLIITEDVRSVHFTNMAIRIRQMRNQGTATRSERANTVSAVVLDHKGDPVLVRNQFTHWKVRLCKADLQEDGRLTLELKLPSECASVQAAIRSCGVPVLLPPTLPEKNMAVFVIETKIPGEYRRLPASIIALWVTQQEG